MQFIRTNGRGILLCLILALPAWWLGSRFPVIGGPILAILLGMLVAIPVKDQGRMAPGIKFTSKKVLQWAVILLGFGLDLTVVLRTGKQSLPIILCTITASLVIAFVLHKVLHIVGKIIFGCIFGSRKDSVLQIFFVFQLPESIFKGFNDLACIFRLHLPNRNGARIAALVRVGNIKVMD